MQLAENGAGELLPYDVDELGPVRVDEVCWSDGTVGSGGECDGEGEEEI